MSATLADEGTRRRARLLAGGAGGAGARPAGLAPACMRLRGRPRRTTERFPGTQRLTGVPPLPPLPPDIVLGCWRRVRGVLGELVLDPHHIDLRVPELP